MKNELHHLIDLKAEAIFQKIKSYREHLHQHPELSFQEFQTMEFVASKLQAIGIPYVKNVAGTGVVGFIKNEQHTDNMPCLGLRADLDALPIHEENDVSYRSKTEGIMHACGHDVHTSVLLGAAEIIWENKDFLSQPVKLIFQPGEETNPGGASLMIEAGVLENPKVEKMVALHVFPDFEVGNFGFKEGLYMASNDEIHIQIDGVGGHAALPERCVNPLLMGAEFVLRSSKITQEKCPQNVPHVLSFGKFEAEGSTNVIPPIALIKGTFRTMNEAWRAEVHTILDEVATEIELKYKGKIYLNFNKGYPFLKNDVPLTRKMKEAFINFFDKQFIHDMDIRMTSEDFSFYSHQVPVCFFRLGVATKNKEQFGVHHPRFDIDENALLLGMKAMTLAAFV